MVTERWLRLQQRLRYGSKGYQPDVTINRAMWGYTLWLQQNGLGYREGYSSPCKSYKPDVTINRAMWGYMFPVTSSPLQLQLPGLHAKCYRTVRFGYRLAQEGYCQVLDRLRNRPWINLSLSLQQLILTQTAETSHKLHNNNDKV